MAALDMTSFASALKIYYDNKRQRVVTYKDNPLHALLPKFNNFTGKSMPLLLQIGDPQGRSALFSTALANRNASTFRDFSLVRSKDYGIASIDIETLQAAADDHGAFMRATTAQVDGVLRQVGRSIAISEYRNHGGSIGRIASGQATVTITLTSKPAATNFEVGMYLKASTADGTSGAVKAGRVQITAIDRGAGTLTAAAAWNDAGNIPTIAANDYLFVEGDFGIKLRGLDSWIPAVAPTAGDSFLGVDRSVDPVRLAGVRHDGSTQTIEEALIDAASKAYSMGGGRPDMVMINPRNYRDLVKLMGSRVQYTNVGPKDDLPAGVSISFQSLMLQADHGVMKIVPDINCQADVAWVLETESWVLASLGEAPKIIEAPGTTKFLLESDADSVQIRTGYYAQLGCMAPGHNCRVTLPTTTGT